MFFGLTLAQVFGVPVGSWIAYAYGWREAFWVVAALATAAAIGFWVYVPKGLEFQPVSLGDLGAVLAAPRLMLAILFTATFLAAIYIPYTYLSPLLEETMGLGRNGVTAALAVYGTGAVLGNLLGGWLADRFGTGRTLTVLAIGQVLMMPLLSSLPWSLPLALVLFLVWAVSGWSFMAGQQARLAALAGPRTPVALSLNAAAIYVGAALGAALGGLAVAGFGLQAAGVSGGIAAIAGVVHIILSRRYPPQP